MSGENSAYPYTLYLLPYTPYMKTYCRKHQPSSATRIISGNQFIIFGLARMQIAVLSTDPNICRKPETEKICGKIVPRQKVTGQNTSLLTLLSIFFWARGRAAGLSRGIFLGAMLPTYQPLPHYRAQKGYTAHIPRALRLVASALSPAIAYAALVCSACAPGNWPCR